MSCGPVVTTSVSSLAVVVEEAAVGLVIHGGAPVSVQADESVLVVSVPASEPVVVEMIERGPVGPQGPVGPPGADADLVCPDKPGSTLTYDIQGRLSRVDYSDGRTKTLAYDGQGVLYQVSCPNLEGAVVTKTLSYTAGLLSAVSISVSQ